MGSKIWNGEDMDEKDIESVSVGDKVMFEFNVTARYTRESDGATIFVLDFFTGRSLEDITTFLWTPEGIVRYNYEED